EVATGIRDGSATDGESELIVIEPQSVVGHETDEILRVTVDAAAGFAARVEGQGRCGPVEDGSRTIIILDHGAVVGVDALASVDAQCVSTIVLVAEHRERPVGAPHDLQPHAGRLCKATVRLPAIDEPRLDLQLVGREDLYAGAIEEPGG